MGLVLPTLIIKSNHLWKVSQRDLPWGSSGRSALVYSPSCSPIPLRFLLHRHNTFCFPIVSSYYSLIFLLHHSFSLSWIIAINMLGKKILSWHFHSPHYCPNSLYLLLIMLSYHSFLIWLQSCFCFISTSLKLFLPVSLVTSVTSVSSQFSSFLTKLVAFDTFYHSILLETFFLTFHSKIS